MIKKTIQNYVVLGLAGISLIGGCRSRFSTDTIETVIVGTETKWNQEQEKDVYLIQTRDKAFRNQDAWYRFKFDSTDIQGRAKDLIGKKVRVTKYGWRIKPMSIYENITKIEPLE
jgi:hypothetical protein